MPHLLSLLFSLFHWIQQQQDDIIDRSVPRPPRSHNFTVKPPVLPKVTYLADKDRPNHDLHLHPRHSALKNDILVQLTGTLEMQSFRHAKSHGRSVLKIHFFIESSLKMIQFKTKSGIFIQKNIQSIESKIFNRIIHSKTLRKVIQNSKIRPKYGFGALLRPLYR